MKDASLTSIAACVANPTGGSLQIKLSELCGSTRAKTGSEFRAALTCFRSRFTRHLAGKVIYDAPVVRVEQDARGVNATFLRGGTFEKLAGDYFVCSIPFTTLKKVEVAPQFSQSKRQVIEQLRYDSASRVFLQVRSRFWEAQKANGFAMADQIIEIWDSTFKQPGPRGILQTYLRGFESEKLTALPEDARIKVTLERMEQAFPGARSNFEKGVAKCWSEDEWARGMGTL